MENNIWVKPDYYDTNVVSSPGYITMLHPQITNKTKLVEELRKTLIQIQLEDNEQELDEMITSKSSAYSMTGSKIPKFHLETSLRKWGNVSVEVLSVKCPV